MPRSKPSRSPKLYQISMLLNEFWVWGTKSSHTVTNLVSTQDGQGLGPILMPENYARRCTCKPEHCREGATSCLALCIEVEPYEFWPANVAWRLDNIAYSPWTFGNKLLMNHPFRIEESDKHGFDFRFFQAHFSWLWVFWAFPNSTLSLCKWFVLKTPCSITSHDWFKKVSIVIGG